MTDATEAKARDGLEVAVEEREAWKRRLTITVAPERVARTRRKVRDALGGDLKLKGFRKGKVPPRIVEDRFGPVIDQRTVRTLVEACYHEALEAEALDPVGDPTFGDVSYDPGESLTFQVEFEVMPTIRLDRTGGFRIKRPAPGVGEEEVDELLGELREGHAVLEPADRRPEEGDMVSVRIARLGEEGGEGDGEPRAYRFELGAGYAIDEVEEAIGTLSPGEEGTFEVHFPEDFDDEELAGSTQRLRIELAEVKARRLPALDDAFAGQVGDFDTLAALRDALREDLERHAESEARQAARDRLLDQVIEANPFPVPPTLVERYLDRVIEAPEDADPERLREARRSLEPGAERQIKRHLVLDTLIEEQGLQATPEEVEERIGVLAERKGVKPEELRRQLRREKRTEELERRIAVEKVFEWLESHSTVE